MTSTRLDTYSRVTEQIVTLLEIGLRPWVQPWTAQHPAGQVSRPLRFNNIPYRGVNVHLLWLASLQRNFTCCIWMTYKQAANLGGQVRCGEKGSPVVFADRVIRYDTDENGNEQEHAIPFLKSYTVFNAEQIDHLTAWWLHSVAAVRVLRDFKETPQQRHEREQPHLLPLPTCDFDTAQVVYRHVNVEGYVTQRLNLYSVPWSYIGQVLPVRVTDREVVIYSSGLEEIARHPLVASSHTGVRQTNKSHHPADDPSERERLLRQRFTELGPLAVQFLDGLLAKQVQGKLQAQQLLALVAHYPRDAVRAAFERAVRFGAYSLAAIRRILAATAKPKPLLEELVDLQRDTLDPLLRADAIGPRPTSDYQHLLLPEEAADDTPSQENAKDQPDDTDRDLQPA